ncbi:hypothetical protein BKA56DRAFT_625612 [Ilyonectria sp. MPI-CAGE-AT-0026]|nr:hypothetical protein BKA56DRAFT_625612 [Ilyonectria sp. MPI-CAGE-AT-0026]
MFQYSLKRSQPPEQTSSHFLESTPCSYYKYEYTGVKICKYLDPRLRDWHHSEEQHQRELNVRSDERDAVAWAWVIKTDYKRYRSCRKSTSGHTVIYRPVYFKDETRQINGKFISKVYCQYWRYNNDHQYSVVPARFNNILFLIKNIILGLETEATPPRDTCCTVDRTTRQRLTCDIAHIPSGCGKIVRVQCGVIWKVFIPHDPTVPYLLITSHGIHNHPPPPPLKVPLDVLVKLHETITQRERTPDSLSIVLRLEAYHKYLTYHKNNNNRIFEDDGVNLLIVTFYREQVKLLEDSNFSSFQVDMNYKHIASNTDHKIIWGTYNQEVKMTIPILRAIVNSQSAEAYRNLYSKVFNFIATEFSIRPKWYHLHNEGI